MLNRDIVKLLASDARMKPHIQELMDRAPYMTDDELDTVVVPLPWYRNALREIRSRHRFAQLESQFPELIDVPQQIISGEVLLVLEQFYAKPMGGSSTMMVPEGKLLFRTATELWWGCSALHLTNFNSRVISTTMPLQQFTKNGYVDYQPKDWPPL